MMYHLLHLCGTHVGCGSCGTILTNDVPLQGEGRRSPMLPTLVTLQGVPRPATAAAAAAFPPAGAANFPPAGQFSPSCWAALPGVPPAGAAPSLGKCVCAVCLSCVLCVLSVWMMTIISVLGLCCLLTDVLGIHHTRPAMTCKTVCREFPLLCFFCKRLQKRVDSAAAAVAAAVAAQRRADQWQQRIKLSIDQLLQRPCLTRLRLIAFLRAFPVAQASETLKQIRFRVGVCHSVL